MTETAPTKEDVESAIRTIEFSIAALKTLDGNVDDNILAMQTTADLLCVLGGLNEPEQTLDELAKWADENE